MTGAPLGRRRVAMWNAAFGYASLGFTLARNILLVPLYLAYIPLGEYGAWLATGGALLQLLVTDYGLSGVVTQRVASLTGGADHARLRAMIVAGLLNAVFLSLGLTVLGGVVALVLPATQGLAPLQVERVVHCFLIAVAANGLGVLAACSSAILRGLQRPVTSGSISLAADIASVALTLVLLWLGQGLYALAFGLLARNLVSVCAGAVALAPYWVAARSARERPRLSDARALWRDAGTFFVTSIAMRLQSQANVLAVGTVLGPQAAAVYGLTVRAHDTVMIVLSQLNSAIGPVLAHLVGAGQQARLDTVIRSVLPVVAAIAALGGACVVVLNQSFVSLWVGPQAWGGAPLTIAMAFALWISAIGFVAYEALLARGEFAFIARGFVAASVLHVVLLWLLLPYGTWLAAAALCASSLVWTIAFWRRVARDMRVDSRALALEPVAIVAAAVLVAALIARLLPVAASWPIFVLFAAGAAAAIGGTMLLARPTLRRLLGAELMTTLRALRTA